MRVIPGITLAASLALFLNMGCGREESPKAPEPTPATALAKAAEPPATVAPPGKQETPAATRPAATPAAVKVPVPAPPAKGTEPKPPSAAPVIPPKDPAVEKPAPPPPTAAAPPPESKPQAPPSPAIPGTVIYAASMGKVTFPHAAHAKRLECNKCHTTKPPQKIPMTKALAHQLCLGCHQEKAAGPVKCLLCHIK